MQTHAFLEGPAITGPGLVLMADGPAASPGQWTAFLAPDDVLAATCLEDVVPVLRDVERAVAGGRFAAGFVSYEAAPAFDSAFRVRSAGHLPLVWFGLYREARRLASLGAAREESFSIGPWEASVTRVDYEERIRAIKNYLRTGDTYQVNFTFRMRAAFRGDPLAFFARLHDSQQGRYSTFIDTGEHAICSASPELFFKLEGEHLVSRPMKGTLARGLGSRDDHDRELALPRSEKDRAENVMIVDMIRNDMGRVALPGSVNVSRLFEVERFPTLFQMTSTVESVSVASFTEILGALFPCASITGAPKVRTMQIISELESDPRGIYCGAIGYLAPGRRAQFNVAIRTATIDRAAGAAEYGVGGGIVWDSDGEREYQECMTKATVLASRVSAFDLLESILWEPGKGGFLLEQHFRRMAESAEYFGFRLDLPAMRRSLSEASAAFGPGRMKVRLLLARDGLVTIDFAAIADPAATPVKLGRARRPVDSSDPFLYHKTTHRSVYEEAKAECPGCDDVLLWNEHGEVTESTIANVIVKKDGDLLTPPVACGLLPGVFRDDLLSRGEIREAVIRLEALEEADGIFLINSVRRWMPAVLMPNSAFAG